MFRHTFTLLALLFATACSGLYTPSGYNDGGNTSGATKITVASGPVPQAFGSIRPSSPWQFDSMPGDSIQFDWTTVDPNTQGQQLPFSCPSGRPCEMFYVFTTTDTTINGVIVDSLTRTDTVFANRAGHFRPRWRLGKGQDSLMTQTAVSYHFFVYDTALATDTMVNYFEDYCSQLPNGKYRCLIYNSNDFNSPFTIRFSK